MYKKFIVSIVGRPNVGKSTLFNRICKKKLAIVDDTPAVTRDRKYGSADLLGKEITIIDTAGLDSSYKDSVGKNTIEQRMLAQTDVAIHESDLVLFVVDSKSGLIPEDKVFAEWLRQKNKPIILVANKSETKYSKYSIHELFSLGFGQAIPVSAEHGDGMLDLFEHILEFQQLEFQQNTDDINENKSEDDESSFLKITILGRPNVGKSTLVNALINEDRVITGPESGLTRDSITINWNYNGRNIQLIDTAGIRKKNKSCSKLEILSVQDTQKAFQFSHVGVIIIDATVGFDRQDINIVNIAIEEGRSLVIAVNKWDLIENKEKIKRELEEQCAISLPQIGHMKLVFISAKNGTNLPKLLDAVINAYKNWNKRITTSKLNNWLNDILLNHPLPLAPSGRKVKIKYITQHKTRPPTFLLFTNYPEHLCDTYIRYMINNLRQDFSIENTPIRFIKRKEENPYNKK